MTATTRPMTSERVVVFDRVWGVRYSGRSVVPGGTDEVRVTVARHEFLGRAYHTETRTTNGVVTNVSEYPADTDYARNRLEWFRTAA